jgi:hypothetical protein
MREAVISAATLVGLIGLVAIFNNSNSSNRAKREIIELGDIDEEIGFLNITETSDDVDELEGFLRSIGMLDLDDDEIPDVIKEDVRFYLDPRAGKKKKKGGGGGGGVKFAYANVRKCIADKNCHAKVQNMQYNQANSALDMVSNSEYDTGRITAASNMVLNANGELENVEKKGLDDTFFTETNDEVTSGISTLRNGFNSGNVFFGFIIPAGIPLNSPFGDYKEDYMSYTKFFKSFVGTYVAPYIQKPKSVSIWVAREEKKVAWLTKTPIKYTARRFPMDKITKMMIAPAATGFQPFFMKGIDLITATMAANHGASADAEKDCFIIWFHQSIPFDVAQFLDPANTDAIYELNRVCSIIHIWVGFATKIQQDAVYALQQFIQPETKLTVNPDQGYRNYFVLPDYTDLKNIDDKVKNAPGNLIVKKVYTNMMVERNRKSCLMQEATYEYPKDDVGEAEYDEEVKQLVEASPTPAIATTIEAETDVPIEIAASDIEMESDTTAAPIATTGASIELSISVEAAIPIPEEFACCGIGATGTKYNIHESSCCSDASTKKWLDTGEDGCNEF